MDLPAIIIEAKRDSRSVEEPLRSWLEAKFSLGIRSLTVLRSAVSLNSVNGKIKTADGRTLFFKFHAEENDQALSEYYRGNVLSDAGLPVIRPLFQSSEPGEQVLIYPWISAPTAFDLWRAVDEGNQNGKVALLRAESELCDACIQACRNSLSVARAEEIDQESIWMLFSRRLTSSDPSIVPRITQFYQGKTVELPNGTPLPFETLRTMRWIINGRQYEKTLGKIIDDATSRVCAGSEQRWPVVVAHGDEHNGNKFFIDDAFVFFDPAFASSSIPALLAFVKTTFHDTFAHPLWLYEPGNALPKLELSCRVESDAVVVDHNWDLQTIAPARVELLKMKMERLWKPLIDLLKEKNLLRKDAFRFVKSALACCPLLVDNLISPKYAPALKVLGLGRCVEMGATAPGNLIDEALVSAGLSPTP
jgi:hypothetical protein